MVGVVHVMRVVHVVLMLVVRVRGSSGSASSSDDNATPSAARLVVVVVMMMMVMQGICASIETGQLLLQSSNRHGIRSNAARSTDGRRTHRTHVEAVGRTIAGGKFPAASLAGGHRWWCCGAMQVVVAGRRAGIQLTGHLVAQRTRRLAVEQLSARRYPDGTHTELVTGAGGQIVDGELGLWAAVQLPVVMVGQINWSSA